MDALSQNLGNTHSFPLKQGVEYNSKQEKFLNITTKKESEILKTIVSNLFTIKKLDIIFQSVLDDKKEFYPLIEKLVQDAQKGSDYSYTFKETIENIKDQTKGFRKDDGYVLHPLLLNHFMKSDISYFDGESTIIEQLDKEEGKESELLRRLLKLSKNDIEDTLCINPQEMKAIFTLNPQSLNEKQINNLQKKLYYLSYELGFGDIMDYETVKKLDELMPHGIDNYNGIEVQEGNEAQKNQFIEKYFQFQKELNKHYDIFDFTKKRKTIFMEYVTWKLETLKTNIDDFENDVTQLNDTGLNRFGNSFTPFNLITLKEGLYKNVFSNIEDFYEINRMRDKLKESLEYEHKVTQFLMREGDMYKRNYDTIGNLAPLDVFVFFEQFRDVNPSDIVLKASIENIGKNSISLKGNKITFEDYNLYSRSDASVIDNHRLEYSKIKSFLDVLYIVGKGTVIDSVKYAFGDGGLETGVNIPLNGFSESEIVFKGTKSNKFSFTVKDGELLQKILFHLKIEDLG